MAMLELALVYILKNEGGLSNQLNDHGGLTNMGVTQATYSAFLGRPATPAEVTSMTPAQAGEVYRKLYWNVIQGDRITAQGIATSLLDMAVLMGPARAVKLAQGVLGQTTDGVMGPKTLAALNGCTVPTYMQKFSVQCCTFFSSLAIADPTQAEVFSGLDLEGTSHARYRCGLK